MKKSNLFVKNYDSSNGINVKSDLDIYDECDFSYLDILKEKEIEVISKVVDKCKCMESVNFNTYYDKCSKCNGSGRITLNGNEVICNHCHGEKKVVKNICPLCNGEGNVVKEGKISVKLNKGLKDGDIVTVEGNGRESNGIKGDLFIKVKISDLECFDIRGNDVYDKRLISFSKEDIVKGISKNIETVKGYCKVKSNGEEIHEKVELANQGIEDGSYYVCLRNELVAVKGKDIYKNVIVNRNMLGFYLNKAEMNSDLKCLNVYYFKKVNDNDYVYIELEDVNNFKIVKLKQKGLDGKHGGETGDLYLRVYFDDEFKCIDDKVYSLPIKLNKYEVSEGKKMLEFNKTKINLSFDKNLKEEKNVEVKEFGFMVDKNDFDSAIFKLNPFGYSIYRVSVKGNKKDKVIYLKDYKRYFYEEVKIFNEGLKVNLRNKKENVIVDNEGNKVIVKLI